MGSSLATTNALLGIMAAISLLEAVVMIAIVGAIVVLSRSVVLMLRRIEEQQIAPAVSRVNGILDDVKHVSSTVKAETGRVVSLVEVVTDFVRHGLCVKSK
jgi:hypothetical protein